MRTQSARPFAATRVSIARFVATLCGLFAAALASAAPLTIVVQGVAADGSTTLVTTDYRWTVEEDATKVSIPGRPADKSNYSFSFHTSYMPVIAAGRVGTVRSGVIQDPDVARLYAQLPPDVCPSPGKTCIDPAKRYYVSIAADGYQMGGAPVVFANGGATATVFVNKYNLPTAQLSVFAFEDNNPINGAPDLPVETGLAGFTVQLLEAGGTYGQSGGAVTQDAFANPLGTTYNEDGSVKVRGNGIVLTGPDGTATIKNLFPAKYTVVIVPPVGSDWHQTSTIEGGLGSDAWVKNNEPSFFQEFGPPGHHVFIGFTRSGFIAKNADNSPVLNGSRTVSGRIVDTHNSRPPLYNFERAAPVRECWVGLNEANGGRALYATACKKDSTFTIPNVPDGTYELVIWDQPLDMIIATTTVTVAGGNVAMGDLPVTSWFGRYQGRVFQDIDGTGLPFFSADFDRPYIYVDPVTGLEREDTRKYLKNELKPPFGEGIASNIRFRDGSIYQSTTTKQDGTFAFTEVFPFFNWMVGEIDYARFKATGATVVVDEGGKVDPAANKAKLWDAKPGLFGGNDPTLAYDPWIRLNPQQQADGNYYRNENCAETGGQCAILLEGMQTFLGQTNHIEWGKQPYGFNENGGIAGIVHYAITRAEDDPRFAAAENWEPGIPRVQVNLYLDCDGDGKPDQPANDGTGACLALSSDKNYTTAGSSLPGGGYAYDPPDVDNYPFCWRDPASCGLAAPAKGPEDIKRSRSLGAGTFSLGDVFKWGAPAASDQIHTGLSKTDAWDDSVPEGCPTTPPYSVPATGEALDCFDGLRNFNQVRPSVFDGGYAFGRVAGQAELPMFIGTEGKGTYIVEAVAPPGYLHQGNGDKNVVFGDSLQASTAALPFACVGMELPVPRFLTLFPGEPNPNWDAGQQVWNKCDMKAVPLLPGTNPAPDFYMFTEAPVAGHGVGFILDDTATEFNQFAPTFGEKYSPPHLPISIQDWTGRELSRVYSDQFGSYNFLVPSSFTINPPYPSGVMPSMIVACMNHPGPIADPANPGRQIIDPHFNRAYTQFCYTLQYLPGKTTYLDTPVLPVAAFAAVDKNPLDCECADGTPAIYSVSNGDFGPWVPVGGGTLTIVSQGKVDVTNPAYDPYVLLNPTAVPPGYTATTDPDDPRLKKTIQRDYGFGSTPGTVTLGNTTLSIVGNSWSDGGVQVSVPAGTSTGQLTIKRAGPTGKESVVGLTVHVGTLLNNAEPKKVNPAGSNGAYKTIQAAIDAAGAGELITVAPGTYPEFVIMDKRVSLQGWGAGSVTINASKPSAGGLNAWRSLLAKKVDARCGTPTGSTNTANCPAGTPIDPDTGAPTLVAGTNRTFDPLPGQTIGHNAANNEPILFSAEEAPGVLVVGRQGLALPGANECLLGDLTALRIDGLTITGSDSGGGVLASGYACGLQVSNNRVVANYGTYGGGIRVGHTTLVDAGNLFTDGVNRKPNIHHNWVSQNGATEAGGAGGITLGTGSDGYQVANNYVCGNFSMADGGGLTHLGVSRGANTIARNKFIFNQTFNQSADPTGGGLFIGGQIPVGGGASDGTGNVTVDANLFQGNQAGAGAGGGVSIARTANADAIRVTNNMVVNNVAAYAAGGVALTDIGTNVRLSNNTVASNVSTATNRQSFGPQGAQAPSLPKVAGIAVIAGNNNPLLVNDIVWGNRSYIYLIDGTHSGLFNPGTTCVPYAGRPTPCTPVAAAQYRDIGRIANGADLAPVNSLFTTGGLNDHLLASPTNQFVAADSTTLFAKPNDFASVIDPNQPVQLNATTVSLQSALTFDETGNFVNVLFSPLTLWETAPGANFGALRSDYHLTATSAAKDTGQASTAANSVPANDYDGQARPFNLAYDVGADEYMPQPSITLVPSPMAFGNQSVNTTVAQTLTVYNTGTAPLASLAVAPLGAPNANQFAFTNNCPATLDIDAACTVTVRFTPTSTGSKTSSLTVTTSNLGSATANLAGNGVTPLYTVSSQAFGTQAVFTTSAAAAFTVTNIAASPGNLVFNGANAIVGAPFTAAAGGTCTATTSLAPGQSCTLNVTFNPTTIGTQAGAVNAPLVAGASGLAGAATGTGVGPNPAIACPGLLGGLGNCPTAASTYSFGNVSGSNTQTFTVTNSQTLIGNATRPFVISSIAVTKTNGGNGTYQRAAGAAGGTCVVGTQLAVGGSCTIGVTFTSPAGNNTTTGTLAVSGTSTAGPGTFSASRNLTGN